MSRSLLLKGLVVVVLYLLFLIATLPARIVAPYISLPRGITLGSLSGSVWNGQLTHLSGPGWALRQLSWQWQPRLGLPALQVALDDIQGIQGSAQLRWDGDWLLQNAHLSAPVAYLLPLLKLPLPVNVGGTMELALPQFRFNQARCIELNGRLQWRGATLTAIGDSLTLGEPRLNVRCEGDGLAFNLQQASEQLELNGQGHIALDGRYRFSGQVTPGAGLTPLLKQGIERVSQAGAAEQRSVEITGRWLLPK